MDFQFYSSSSSSKSFFNYPKKHQEPPPLPPHHRSPLAVRKLPAKPWKKFPIAPLPPVRPKVYKVDALDFKQAVQELTAAPEFQPRRLQSLAPPPLSVVSSVSSTMSNAPTLELLSPLGLENALLSSTFLDLTNETRVATPVSSLLDTFPVLSPQGFGVSTTAHDWCSFSFLSPGTLSLFDQSIFL